MRTTIRLDDELLRAAKLEAARTGRTLTALIEEALRERLARRRQASTHPRAPLPTYSGRGLQAGVDLDDTAALVDWMERGDGTA